jgi:hypothetical protein
MLPTPANAARIDGGFAVKKLIKFVFVVALVFGGWALAAASLHVVRAPGTMAFGYVPFKVQLITKNAITFRETYVDTTKWSVADRNAHKGFVDRLEQLNKSDLAPAPAADAHAAATPAEIQKATPQTTETPQKSIFDFNR